MNNCAMTFSLEGEIELLFVIKAYLVHDMYFAYRVGAFIIIN